MASQRNLVCLYASLEDRRDELKRVLALFDSGISHLDGSGTFIASDRQLQERGLYLLDLYHQEVNRILAELDADINDLDRVRKLAC